MAYTSICCLYRHYHFLHLHVAEAPIRKSAKHIQNCVQKKYIKKLCGPEAILYQKEIKKTVN